MEEITKEFIKKKFINQLKKKLTKTAAYTPLLKRNEYQQVLTTTDNKNLEYCRISTIDNAQTFLHQHLLFL